MIRGIVFDFEALVTSGAALHAGIGDTIAALRQRGIAVGAVSGKTRAMVTPAYTRSGLNIDALVCKDDVGAEKGKGFEIHRIRDGWGLQPHEMAMVAANERGWYEAINAPTLSFRAGWGEAMRPYALRLDSPAELIEYLDIFFRKTAHWYARVDAQDAMGRPVTFRTLIDANGAGSQAMRNAILRTLKDRQDVLIGGTVSLSRALVMHLIASAYLEGLLTRDINQISWQMYPGHNLLRQDPPPVIADALEGVKFVRAATRKPGLIRWSNAVHSSGSRMRGEHHLVQFVNQPSTVYVPERFNAFDRRFIVLDDFTTEGFSLETARNLLLAAGAKDVTMLAFGKYHTDPIVAVPANGTLKPHLQRKYEANEFTLTTVPVTYDPNALTEFSDSMGRLQQAAIGPKLLT